MKWAALALLSAGAAMAAEPAPEAPRCNPESFTQLDMNFCAQEGLLESDRKLNAAYQALIAYKSGSPNFVARLRKAQKAWIAFRDAEIDATFACEEKDQRLCWGSMHSMSVDNLKKQLTDARRARLEEMLSNARETG